MLLKIIVKPYNLPVSKRVKTHLEGKVLQVLLHSGVSPSTPDQSLGIKDRVLGVRGQLVLCSIPNQTLALCGEGHI